MKPGASGVNRRQAVGLAVAGFSAAYSVGASRAQPVVKDIRELKPGEFTWHPDRAPEGPVAVVVSIPDQRVHIYRNGIRIGVSTCSTGRPGHSTPTGVFTVLQKDRRHRSSTYNNAPMPNMNRLTWSGIALHAGQLPGYPASHGCIRLPMEFSQLLFTVTHIGTPVIISNTHSDPAEIVHPGLVLSLSAQARLDGAVAHPPVRRRPAQVHDDNTVPPVSIIVSGVDRRIIVLENGDTIADGPATISDPLRPLGSHVYVLAQSSEGRSVWHGVGHQQDGVANTSDVATLQRIQIDESLLSRIWERMHVGATLTTVDLPLSADTRSGKDFVVIANHDA